MQITKFQKTKKRNKQKQKQRTLWKRAARRRGAGHGNGEDCVLGQKVGQCLVDFSDVLQKWRVEKKMNN
jgi:hypothetical protein